MRTALTISAVELRRFLRDRSNLFFVFVFHSYFTSPSTRAKSVKSRPVPTFLPAWIEEPT